MNLNNRDYKFLDFIGIPYKSSPGAVLLMIIETIVSALIPSLQILISAYFIDTAIGVFNGQEDKNSIFMPLVCILLMLSYQYIAAILMNLVRTKMKIRLTETYKTAIIEKRAKLDYKHVENNDTWDLIERVGQDPTERLCDGFNILLQMIGIAIRVVSTLLVIMAQVWWAGLIILVFTIPLFWLAIKSGKLNYKASQDAAKYKRRAGYLQSILTGRNNVEERTLFAYSDEINKQYYDKFLSAYHIDLKTQRNRFIKMKSGSLITVFISIIITGVLIAPLGSGTITVGMFMVLATSTIDLAQMMSWRLTRITSELASHREYLRDLSAFSKLSETDCVTLLPDPLISEPNCIQFINVSFAYPDTDKMILKNLNLKLYAKKYYAFVGANGAGKSTITKLLTGLYENYTGDILVDGISLRNITHPKRKAMFSVVYQDYAKYQISMKDSIGLGRVHGASEQVIRNVANVIGLNEVVAKLPYGLDTPLGKIRESSFDLSGGEWQRVAIARSILSQAPIHILDEPTAALDPVIESELYKLFGQISEGRTTVFITHRLGAARLADEILVIADGRVAEQGSHNELMNMGGIYFDMFEAQRGWYE